MTLQYQKLLTLLKQQPPASGYLLAFSGGLDSCVLLDLMHKLSLHEKIPLRAIHINHGLQGEAEQWVSHCQQICEALKIPLQVVHLNMKPGKGESIEAVAREQRYQAFESELKKGEMLLLAQHRDDQAETLLLQLLRGGGPEGLACMSFYKAFSLGAVFRPLLDVSRAEIEEYAHSNNLDWIEDPSNTDIKFDRNYLRHEVLPLLKKRWPSYNKTFSRSARLCAAATEIIGAQASELLKQVRVTDSGLEGDVTHEGILLNAKSLSELAEQQQIIVIREWLRQQQLSFPSEVQMRQILIQMLKSSNEASPLVTWADIEVRRYRNHLYAFKAPDSFDSTIEYDWDLGAPLTLPELDKCLTVTKVKGEGISLEKIRHLSFTVRFRSENLVDNSGESNSEAVKSDIFRGKSAELENKIPGTTKASKLKKTMQQSGIPPWLRNRVPILSLNDELIAIVGWWISPKYRSLKNESGIIITSQSICEK